MNRKTKYAPDGDFMDWCGKNLPSPISYYITDFDSIIRNRKGCIITMEIKRKMSSLKPAQAITQGLIDSLLTQANGKKISVTPYGKDSSIDITIDYKGYYLVQLSSTNFTNSDFYINGVKVTEQRLIEILSFKDFPECNC